MKPVLANSQPLTSARLSIGNASPALSTHDELRFQLDHALARDAVHAALDVPLLERGLRERGLTALALRSAAGNRAEYLRRPDLGRTLSENSRIALEQIAAEQTNPSKILFILADGLSALALERHALPLLDATFPLITNHLPLISVVTNARVALADQIGQILSAQITVLFIGERPGLSSPDSLGVYLTWQPRPGRTDAERNCISNIRAEGLSYAEAAHRIAHYIAEARRLQTTGISLKDPDGSPVLVIASLLGGTPRGGI
jgi:ethanolamine ammonia-lyase small subunit